MKGRSEICLEIDKGLRRYRRLQVLWMSSNLCMDEGNILNLLTVDLCRSVSNFICAGPSAAVLETTIGVGHENRS